jgi:hypothetical protein
MLSQFLKVWIILRTFQSLRQFQVVRFNLDVASPLLFCASFMCRL